MKKKSFVLITALIAVLFGLLLFTGCKNPVDNDDEGEIATTGLKIQNETSFILVDVMWGNAVVSSSLAVAQSSTVDVAEGVGYLYFSAKGLKCRTREIIAVSKDETKELVITNNTIVVAVDDTDNIGTLGNLQSTVVFWDDAEGEMPSYHERLGFAEYYNSGFGGSRYYFYPPKNGKKSIAVGEPNTAKLHLRIDLSKAAKLSFWYANKRYGSAGTTFSINGTTEHTWTTDVNWSKLEFNLDAGQNDLVWEKKDGGYAYFSDDYSNFYYSYYYLSLDDILIYYTE